MSFRWVAGLFTILAFAVLGGAIYQVIFGFKPQVAVQREEGPFFRVDVKLDYKGKPHDISYVAACNAKVTFYADNSTTREVGKIPGAYGHRMDDGQAIVVETPNVCIGATTANRWVPENYVPLIVVFENAKTLAFGRAYITEDAYESPLAELKVHKATITAATRTEFDEFAKNGAKNVVTRERYHSPESHSPEILERVGVKALYKETFGYICHMAVRYRLSEEKREALRREPEYVPNENWTKKSQEMQFLQVGTYSNDKDDLQYGSNEVSYGWGGILRQTRDSTIGDPKFRNLQKQHIFPTIYPVNSSIRRNDILTASGDLGKQVPGTKGTIAWNVEMEPAKRGFAYCYEGAGMDVYKKSNETPFFYAENGKTILNDTGRAPFLHKYFQGDTFYIEFKVGGGLRSIGGDVL